MCGAERVKTLAGIMGKVEYAKSSLPEGYYDLSAQAGPGTLMTLGERIDDITEIKIKGGHHERERVHISAPPLVIVRWTAWGFGFQ